MQTSIADFIKDTPQGREADAILRTCVHCGFCTATCPTYQLLGNELDGPRGRIYLIKQALEGQPVSARSQLHLDRCLTCRSCETTCPSGVRYGRLLEIGRDVIEERVRRSPMDRLARRVLRLIVPYPRRFGALLALGRLWRPLLPRKLRRKIPPARAAGAWPSAKHPRTMLILDGCAQPAAAPNINAATARVLDRLGIGLVRAAGAGCCGALSLHLSAHNEALDYMRRNIDAWWPHVQAGAEAIVITASGCGATVKEYGELLKHDPDYADKAARIATLAQDITTILAAEDLPAPADGGRASDRVAVHTPCTLQHGQGINGVIEQLLTRAGYTLTPVPDAHLCCGSAGTYSILQPRLANRLLDNKLAALEGGKPNVIVTANIGCLMHLETKARTGVKHWIELIDEALAPAR